MGMIYDINHHIMSSLYEIEQGLKKFDLPTEDQFRGFLAGFLRYDPRIVRMGFHQGSCGCNCLLFTKTEIGKSEVNLRVVLHTISGFYMIRRAFGVGRKDIIEELFVPAGLNGELMADKMADYKVRVDDYNADRGGYGKGLLTRIVTLNYDAGNDQVRSISYGGRTTSAIVWNRDQIFAERDINSASYQILADDTKDMGIGDLDQIMQGEPDVRATLGNILDLRGAGDSDAAVPTVGFRIIQ